MRFLFKDYVLDPERRELTLASSSVPVGPQVFDVLLYLLQNRDRVVSKDDLLEAVWDGRIVSESTVTSHINAVRKAIGDNGNEQRLVKTVPRKGFRFIGDVREARCVNETAAGVGLPEEVTRATLPLFNKPSIAVLPFQSLCGDPEQAYFADGVVEEIITALSRVRWLFVIARNSSFVYRDCAFDVKQIGKELGVGYVLEGSMRKSADRVRITGQLIDATTGVQLWAERFEGTVDDIFELQDRIATSVAGAIAPRVELAEIERTRNKPTGSLNAYDCYLRGLAHVHRGTRESIDQALPLFERGIELDPEYASAYAMAGWCYFWRKVNGWCTDREWETREGTRLARRAVELGRDDAVALTRGAHALSHLAGDLDSGIALVDRAKFLNPNLAAAWFLGGFLRTWQGEPDDAIAHFERAMLLNPLDPELYRMQAGIGMAHLFARRIDVASHWAELSYRNLPSFLMVAALIAATRAHSGRINEAQQAMGELRELDPSIRISNLKDWLPIRRREDLAVFSEGLRLAGMPEQ
ncbi:winged helix-turn-helix domain-containing protein [Hyphomicrobium sp. MC1]|uniref:winged helix-turn-helix domain-containing protein n=1 Tax=Hyphomicrobium sp. (strain MC1) TaxID=717785 RepID=UPI000213E1F9|nr:winged helix-turn-helix domain-containing tetratricopeptide repeat protein [Hyphomicrobium sp. MC1]CCB66452.1 Transcriptional regulator, CadC-family [Hyphomicrobium sp. MC1]